MIRFATGATTITTKLKKKISINNKKNPHLRTSLLTEYHFVFAYIAPINEKKTKSEMGK